jgi:hypothetical protein
MQRVPLSDFSEYHNKKKPARAGTFGMAGYKEGAVKKA